MRLRTIIFLFCVLGLSNAQNNNNGNCSIEGFVPSDWTVIFKPDTIVTDEAADEVIFSGAFTGKLDDLSCTPSATGKSNYVDFEAKDGKFTIKTAADIVKLDEETAQTSSPFYLNYVCTMNCDAGQSQLGIAVKIADYNNHKPEFSQATYTYTVASPIMPHTDFTLEGDVIKATDLDFSNNNIIFTVDPPHFVIDTTADSTDSNKKTFVAKIRAKSVVQLKETTTTYTLTATDVGTDPGPLSQTASLTFTIDADNSLDIPSFEYQDSQTDYSFQYQSDNTLKPLSGSIKLNTQHSLTTKNFELLGDMKGKFSIEYDSNAKEITLSVQEEIKDPTVTLTVLTLNINNGQVTVSTPVIIYFTTSSIFKFDKHIYTGSYDDAKNQVNLDESITITSSGKSDVNIEIAGDLAKYFSAVKGTDAGTWSIKVATPAPTADELKGYTYLNLVLTATEDDIDGKDTASLLVKLPSHVLQFSKILYEATYNEDNTVTMSDKITFTTNEDTVVDITVDTNYEKYFVVSQEDKSYIIKSTTTPLPDEILSKQTEIAVIITAKDGYQNTQQAVVKITLPEINNEKAPKFTKSYYKSEYKQNQTDNYLDFTDPLTFDNVDDPSKVKISLDAYSDNFEIVYDKSQKKWRVHIKDPLTSKDFDSWTEILVIMEATESGVTKTGKSVLVIDLTTDVGPQFVELYYSAEYKQNDTKYIDFHTALAFEKEVDPKNLQITLDTYTNNFAVTYDTAQKEWRIQIKSPLSSKDFESLSEIVLTMEATQSGVNKTGKAVLVIELITETGPEFSKLYYASEYKQYQKDYIDFKEDVTFTENIDPNNLKITIDSYTDNFAVVYDTAQTKWRIEIKLPLNSQDFESLSEIVLTMEATEIGVTKTGKSVLVIELTTDATEVGPQFNELFYQCEYKQGQIDYLDFGTDIGFTENIDPKNLKIILNSYTDNFAVTYDKDEKKWRIQITVPLDSNVFDSLSEIILTMEAIETGVTKSGKAMLVIELKTDAREVGPQFKDLYYQSEYKQGKTDYIDFKTDVAFEEDIDPKNIKISMDSYTDNFAIVYDTAQNKWRIQINSPLSSKDFESLSEIVLTMEATESGVTKTGKSVLIIELKTDATEVGPQFKDLYYEAEYKQGQTDYIDFKSPVAFKADNDPNNLKISIDSYTNNFAVTYDATNKKWRIQIKSPLTSKDFESLSEIVITMEATESGVTKTGKSVLVIELKTDATEVGPQFKDLYYEAEYKEGQTDYIDFKSAVAFREDNDPNNLKISIDSYTDNFAVTYDTTNKKWRIQLISPLDSKDFESLSEIVITMEATESGVTKTGKSVLVIELKTDATEVGPQFKDLYYQSEYKQGQTRYIDFKTPVAFERDIDPKNIKISMDSYMDNFEVTYDTAQQMWRIKIKSPLDSKDFESLSEIVLTMEATESGITKTGKSVLVIELKTDATEVGPQFKDLYYQSEYKQGQTDYLDFKTDVTFEADNDPKNIEITIDSYKDNFAITYDTTEKKWRIQITDPLDSKIFDSLSEIVLTMEATETGVTKTGKSVLVIELKTDTTEVGPQFKELYYQSEYKQGQTDYIDFKTALAFEQDIDPKNVKISVDDAYKDNFAITYDTTEKKWRIQITDPLDSKIFDSLSEIVLTMEATETGVTKTGKSVLVIELKTDTTEVGPQFKELYYRSEYKQGQSDYIDFKTALAFEQDIDPKNVKISVDDAYKDNFAITYDTTEKKWRIQITDPLDSKIFDSLSEIVLTMEATETGVTKTGKSVLVIELKTDTTEVGPQFKELYYQSQYKQGQTDYIYFKTALAFEQDIDPKNVKISVDDAYKDNFAITYDTTENKWRIQITDPLDSKVFDSLSEIVLTMEATETGITKTGKSVLVIELKTDTTEVGPQFKELYYRSEYKQGQSDYIDFKTALTFEQDIDPKNVKISVDDAYKDNFAITYDTTEKKWRIKIIDPLDSKVFDSLSEIVLTMEATETGVTKTGKSVLVIELKTDTTEVGPQFKELYYRSEYKQGQSDYIDFKTALDFEQDIDPKNIKISVDDAYKDNFAITYDTTEKKWRIQITDPLDSKIFDSLSEIVLTMEATETGITKTGKSVLVIELKTDTTEVGPQFKELYYQSEYKQGQTDYIDFKTALAFEQDIDPKNVKISVDDVYKDNFAVTYDTTEKKWRIQITDPLDSKVFDSLSEIILTMEATETGVTKTGRSVLVIELKTDTTEVGPQFKDLYYEAEYKKDQTDYIDFKTDVAFTETIDPKNLKIAINDYTANFDVEYDSDKWRIKITKPLDDSVFDTTTELILVMEASETGITSKGSSVLVIKLTGSSVNDKVPKFKDVYYSAEYPKEGSGTIPFDQEINFENIADISKVHIVVSDYTDYFSVAYDTTKTAWSITIVKPLDLNAVTGPVITTLSATIDGDDEHKPVAAFTLKLPELTAPIFSKPYYQAEYKVSGTTATVNLIDQIGFGADVDDTNIDITSNDYSEYFTFTYEEKQWKVVTNGILDLKELDRSDLVVSITATDKTTKLTSFSVIDLKLPNVNTEDAPKFSKTYYTASYTVSGDNKATVTLDEQFAFSNRDDPKSVTLTTDNYQKNFIIKFTDGKWTITVDQNLDADTLNSNDIVMSVIATDSTTKDVGECTLLMTLPKINSKDAPRFDKPYYQSECDDATTSLDAEIAITNKDDLSDINVSILEQDYKDNFNITFDDAAKVWKIAVLSVPKIKTSTNDLLLTLIATEKGNEELGQAALVLNFLAVTAPKFSSIQYRGSYKAAEVSSFEIGDIKITNKDKQDDIQLKLSLDSDSDISKYFKFTLTDNVWKVTLKDPLPDDDIKGKTELVLTLSATEKNNDEIGYATVIIALEDNVVTSDLTFSDVYYSADYIKSSPLPDIELDKDISLKSSEDLKDAVVEFVATDEFNANNYFGVNPTGTAGVYTISSKKELPDKILEAHSLSVVLQASLDQLPKAFATLVIDLPVDGESNSIDFKKALYEANYTISSDDERSFGTEGITIDTKEAAGNLKVLISPDSLYGAYFDVKQDNYEVIVTVKAKIPSDVYEKVSVIPLALEATSSGTQKVGKTVVNVNIEYNKGSVKFSSSLYNGNYTVKEGEATIYVDEIALATDQDADHISVDVDNDYHKYFKASYDKSKVTITKTADIPIADLKKISTISIQLKATVKNSKVEDNTVINLLIITDDTPTPEQGKISFDNTINTGEYSVVNGKGEFKEDKEIKLTTDRQNDEIEVKFSDDSEFKDKFSISYKDQVVTVEKKEDLSDDDFQSNAYISLEMIATITKSQQSSSAVLNIRMNNDGGNDNKHISFEYPAYKGLYNVSNNMADLDYEKITVTTDQTDENVEVKIAGPYNEYFDVLYTNKVVRISLKDTAASTTLRSLTNIPVVLYAQVKTTTRSATTVVNLQVRDYDNDNNPTESIQFPKLINDAQYIVSKGEFSSDDMVVVTNVLDEYIECDLSNDYHYEKYFQCNYKHTRVQVTLYRTLPKDEIKKLNNIALKVTISDKNRQGVYGDAILNIELKHQSETTDKEMNTTGYIVAISILSVLMFILLAGTAGFYFYKFRKSRYDKMTEDEYMNTKVRFDKSALKRPSNRDSTIRSGSIEERRPTGFIFNSTLAELGEEEPRDSSTDPDMKERKKSVAFDENVEKLQIDSVNDDDIDKALEEDKSEEASAKVE
ncbi:uncharacterized protein LOC114349448 isoform X4 [Diabrotica virgifera virgifera]|uniref:Cadherin domain-containing protein n=1 Tax=Diabrotica virgifera virgifera TaxID=50390 RepID=A0ABM5JWD6_DIAVI|nr:uncharacterized protein LOC114349448 isoform X4 [Diabrotica virgifera virgifera]